MGGRGSFGPGLRLALTTLTVAPLRAPAGPLNRASAGIAMSLAPAVGAVLGAVIAGVALLASWLGASALLAGVLAVATGAVLTRGLHLDGLADTADALGSYRDADRALAIMRKPDAGPFATVVLVLVLLAQVAAVTAVLGRAWFGALVAIVVATATGRVGIALACRRGVPAARPDGLGALVAGTVGLGVPVASGLAFAALSLLAVPGRPWQGPLAVAASLLVAAVVIRHAVRRLGGVTGDVLGAVAELTITTAYIIVSI